MKATRTVCCCSFTLCWIIVAPSLAQPHGPASISDESKQCIECHKGEDPGIYQQWGQSRHFRANVGCYECHRAGEKNVDGFDHFGNNIAIIVSPQDCAKCHSKEVKEFSDSHHSKAARILGSLDNRLAEVVEGNSAFISEGFPNGNSAAAVSGC